MNIDPETWSTVFDSVLKDHEGSVLANIGAQPELRSFVDAMAPPHRHIPVFNEKKVIIFGIVPRRNGIPKMGIEGDRYSQSKHLVGPMVDGECVHDVLILGSPGEEYPPLLRMWNKQIEALKKLDEIAEDESDDLPIMEAPIRNIGFLKNAVEGGELVNRLEVIWDKYQENNTDGSQEQSVIGDRYTTSDVKKGSLYAPSVLDHSTSPYCNLRNDVVKQHELFDDKGHRVPPWEILNEFRPGSIVMVIATLYDKKLPYTDKCNRFYARVSELRGAWAQVLRRGPGAPERYKPPRIPSNWNMIGK